MTHAHTDSIWKLICKLKGSRVIPYGRQTITDIDRKSVASALDDAWLTQGPPIEAFEQIVADRVHAAHAVAFMNATAALHAAAWAGGLGVRDLLYTSSLSFIASANCGAYVGADVGFVDIDPRTLNMDVTKVPEDAKAIVPVHFAGLPADLSQLNRRPDVIIEDAAHAMGAETPDGPVGCCAHSDMAVFSFHPVKTVTAGEGGVVTTNNAELAERLRRFRHHGIERIDGADAWEYVVNEVGMNFRMTGLQAALGSSQMAQLDGFLERRDQLVSQYRELLADLPLTMGPEAPAGFRHGRHLFTIQVEDRRAVFNHMRDNGVGVQVHYVPIHHHPPYAAAAGSLPQTDKAYDHILSLPLFPLLTDAEQIEVVDTLRGALAS